jgi:imidazolonepropionase-like amidohydrolase
MYDLVFKQGNIFFNGNFVLADLAINGEKIAAIGENLIGKTEISAQNKWVLPGAIDAHTHFLCRSPAEFPLTIFTRVALRVLQVGSRLLSTLRRKMKAKEC